MKTSRVLFIAAAVWTVGAVALFSSAPILAATCAYLAIVFNVFGFGARLEEKNREKLLSEARCRFESVVNEIKEKNNYDW